MSQVVTGMFLRNRASLPKDLPEAGTTPVAAASAAIERCLAQAYEIGDEDAVRLLHAVNALLANSPRP